MKDRHRVDYLPTPYEIARACASIRASWSPHERRRRFVGYRMTEEFRPAWRPPVIDTSTLRHAASSAATDLAS